MSQGPPPEVFTSEELARAAGVPHADVVALLKAGQLRCLPGTAFISRDDAISTGRQLRARLAGAPVTTPSDLFAAAGSEPRADRALAGSRGRGMPAVFSSLVHAALLTIVVLMTAISADSAGSESEVNEPVHLVFLATPGPGGGGGGGGLRNPLPPSRLKRQGPKKASISVPMVTPEPAVKTEREVELPKKPTPAAAVVEAPPPVREPEPVPAKVLTAPVVAAASAPADRAGVIEHARGEAESQGAGTGGGSGSGRGTGNGEGAGDGIGPGSGGGIGGGPYRPGSGIAPPRLLREVKADYTDEARRRSIAGEVVMEIVVRRDGSVGDVTVLKSLGGGLDQRAVQAVKQWRFDPARRQGAAVDVLVEVAVEFSLR